MASTADFCARAAGMLADAADRTGARPAGLELQRLWAAATVERREIPKTQLRDGTYDPIAVDEEQRAIAFNQEIRAAQDSFVNAFVAAGPRSRRAVLDQFAAHLCELERNDVEYVVKSTGRQLLLTGHSISNWVLDDGHLLHLAPEPMPAVPQNQPTFMVNDPDDIVVRGQKVIGLPRDWRKRVTMACGAKIKFDRLVRRPIGHWTHNYESRCPECKALSINSTASPELDLTGNVVEIEPWIEHASERLYQLARERLATITHVAGSYGYRERAGKWVTPTWMDLHRLVSDLVAAAVVLSLSPSLAVAGDDALVGPLGVEELAKLRSRLRPGQARLVDLLTDREMKMLPKVGEHYTGGDYQARNLLLGALRHHTGLSPNLRDHSLSGYITGRGLMGNEVAAPDVLVEVDKNCLYRRRKEA